MNEQADEADRTASAMREDVARVAGGRPCHWVAVHDIAQRLGEQGHEHVRENFLITGNLKRYLTLFLHEDR